MASITSTYTGASRPRWLAEEYASDILVPGGVRLVPADFPAPVAPNTVKRCLSGTVIGRTFTERSSGLGFGPAAATDEEIFIVFADSEDLALTPDVAVVRPGYGALIAENYLPGFAALPAALQTIIRSKYTCIIGAISAGNPFV